MRHVIICLFNIIIFLLLKWHFFMFSTCDDRVKKSGCNFNKMCSKFAEELLIRVLCWRCPVLITGLPFPSPIRDYLHSALIGPRLSVEHATASLYIYCCSSSNTLITIEDVAIHNARVKCCDVLKLTKSRCLSHHTVITKLSFKK
jgi:hypothetical protein